MLPVDSHPTPDPEALSGPQEPREPLPRRSTRNSTRSRGSGPHSPQGEASTPDGTDTDGETTRQKIAALLWWSVPASTDEEAKARTEQLLDEHRAEVLREAEGKAREIVAKLWVDGTTQKQLDRAGGARAVEWEIGLMASGNDEPATAGEGSETTDTLPEWLYQRFAVIHGCPPWDTLDDGERAYWEHQAAAVRRAVARGGFKNAEVSA